MLSLEVERCWTTEERSRLLYSIFMQSKPLEAVINTEPINSKSIKNNLGPDPSLLETLALHSDKLSKFISFTPAYISELYWVDLVLELILFSNTQHIIAYLFLLLLLLYYRLTLLTDLIDRLRLKSLIRESFNSRR